MPRRTTASGAKRKPPKGQHRSAKGSPRRDALAAGQESDGLKDPLSDPLEEAEAKGNKKKPKGTSTRREAEHLARAMENTEGSQMTSMLTQTEAAESQRLGASDGIKAYVQLQLGIDPTLDQGVYNAVVRIIEKASVQSRDQVALWVKLFHGAEMGQFKLERLSMTNQTGGGATGDSSGAGQMEVLRNLQNLAAVFPNAASQIQELFLPVADTVARRNAEQYVNVLPGIKAIFAASGKSPNAREGDTHPVRVWERKARA